MSLPIIGRLHFNPLKAELNPICHFLALLGARHILHVGRITANPLEYKKFDVQVTVHRDIFL